MKTLQIIEMECINSFHEFVTFNDMTVIHFKVHSSNLNYIKRISTIFLNCISKQVCELILLIHELDENHNNDDIPFHFFKWNWAPV